MTPAKPLAERMAGESLWRFSLALYARPAAAAALIALQDRVGADVNLMLYALWLGTQRLRLKKEEFIAAQDAVAPLDEMIAVLRRQRRALRENPDPELTRLRRRLLHLELEAERRAQYRLAARICTGVLGNSDSGTERDRLAAAGANLALYLGAEGKSPEADVLRQTLAALTRSG